MLARSGPGALRLLLIDAKRVELAPYSGLPHLVGPIVTEPEEAALALSDMVARMEQRYALLAQHGVRSVADLPQRVARYVVVVDELADLVMSSKDVRDHLVRLAQKSRAAGIHLVLATQRPSTDVITGLLKANVPGRMALAVASNVDSRVILDMAGAEDLLGRGDMLFKPPWLLEPIRVQGAMVSDEEVRAVVARYASVAPPTAPMVVTDHARDVTLALYGLAALVLGLAAWMLVTR
jgi:S-DNA-T family DNA segregation ATPase FtsK/SpoIIIE